MPKKRKAEKLAIIGADLLACPWCGEDPQVRSFDGVEWRISCQNPSCPIEPDTKFFATRVAAIAAWNSRHPGKTMDFEQTTVKIYETAIQGGFDPDVCVSAMNLIPGGFGVPMIRRVLENFMAQKAYDVARIMAEFLKEDHRVSYQKLGNTMLKKIDAASLEATDHN